MYSGRAGLLAPRASVPLVRSDPVAPQFFSPVPTGSALLLRFVSKAPSRFFKVLFGSCLGVRISSLSQCRWVALVPVRPRVWTESDGPTVEVSRVQRQDLRARPLSWPNLERIKRQRNVWKYDPMPAAPVPRANGEPVPDLTAQGHSGRDGHLAAYRAANDTSALSLEWEDH